MRHHVVAELVGVAHDFGQARREQLEARACGGRHAVAHLAAQLAVHVGPQAEQSALVVAFRVGIGQRPGLLATRRWQRAGETGTCRVGEVGLQCTAPVVARAGGERHRRIHAHARERQVDADRGHAARRVGRDREAERLVVQQQRVGAHVVRAQRLAVEIGRVLVGHVEAAAVEHDVAANLAHAGLLHPLEQQPDPFEHELRVAAALDDEVAVEHAVFHRALQPHRRVPAPRRAEHFERREGRQQLHQRGRVHRLLGLPGQALPRAAHFLHHRDNALAWQFGAVERCRHFVGQGGCERREQGAEERCSEDDLTPLFRHALMISRPLRRSRAALP